MIGKASASRLFAVALAGLVAFVAVPALAHEVEGPRPRDGTCRAVLFGEDYEFKIPCPPAIPAARRDIVVDPDWPHDQAMTAEHDWPHDSAMVVPRAEEAEEAIPLFDELLGAIERDVRESKVRRLLEDWLSGKSK